MNNGTTAAAMINIALGGGACCAHHDRRAGPATGGSSVVASGGTASGTSLYRMTGLDDPGRYRYLSFNAPLSERRADTIADRLADAAPRYVIDIGCGWGELLLRIVERSSSAVGLGVDVDEELLVRGCDAALRRGIGGRVRFENLPGERVSGQADLVVCVGSSHAVGGTSRALPELRRLVRPGGRLLFGDGLWDPRATTDRGLVPEAMLELPDLGGLVDAAVAAGFRPLFVETSTTDELDAFESGFLADYEEWLMTRPRHPDAERIRATADQHRTRWLRGYRAGFGFAYLTLGLSHE